MTHESETDILPDRDSDELASAPVTDSLSKRNRQFAKKLNDLVFIYALYGALDGLSLSYSMVKYSFDMLYTTSDANSSDVMHDWMMTPTGIASIAAESVVLIGFSLLANAFENDKSNKFKQFVAISWSYCRDALKGLKNAYKGVRSGLQVAGVFTGLDMRYAIVPVGIVLGVLSSLNRIFMRKIKSNRKDMTKANAILFQEIKDATVFDEIKCAEFRERIQRQYLLTRYGGLFAAAYGGIVDGLYLFMGGMGVAALSPPVYLIMAALCIFYTVSCIVVRTYEEYRYQRDFIATQAKVELALCGRELELLFLNLQKLSDPLRTTPYEGLELDQKSELAILEAKIVEFEARRNYLRAQITLSYWSATLAGLKDGLAAYGVIASGMFAVATVYAILLMPFPPAFLIATVLAGMACVIGFISHALVQNYFHLHNRTQAVIEREGKLNDLLETIKHDIQEVKTLEPSYFKEAITDGMIVDPSPQFATQECCEVARSFLSGVAKGQKSVDYTFNPLQEADERGHYHDTPIMFGLTVLSSSLYAVVLALRAYARGFGRDPLDSVKRPPPATPTSNEIELQPIIARPLTATQETIVLNEQRNSHSETPGEAESLPVEVIPPARPPTPPAARSWLSSLSFFSKRDEILPAGAPLAPATTHIAPGLV